MEKRLYITQNLINGKVYAGKHFWKEGTKYMGSGYALKKAFLKYGKQNFKIRWLKLKIHSSEDLDKKEIRLIKLLKYRYGANCYNIQRGGFGGYFTYYMSDEEKQKVFKKISDAKKQQYSNGLTEKQKNGRIKMRARRIEQYNDPHMAEVYKKAEQKRSQSLKKRLETTGPTDKEKNRGSAIGLRSLKYVTYRIVYPNGDEKIETKTLKEFVATYNTQDMVFSRIKKEGMIVFKQRENMTKHVFPSGTLLYYISEVNHDVCISNV